MITDETRQKWRKNYTDFREEVESRLEHGESKKKFRAEYASACGKELQIKSV